MRFHAAVFWPEPLVRHRRLLAALAFVVLPLLSFGNIAADVLDRDPFTWERPLMHALRSLESPGLTRALYALSFVGGGSYGFALPLLLLVLAWRQSRRMAGFFLLAVGGAAVLNVALKVGFQRDRPTILPRLWEATSYSFPSGHAMLAAALATAVVALLWRTRYRLPAIVLGTLYAVFMGVSRVYLGVHYPTDVLAGTALSVAWVSALALLSWPLLPRAQRDARQLERSEKLR